MRRNGSCTLAGILVVTATLTACRDEASAPLTTAPAAAASLNRHPDDNSNAATIALVRQLAAGRGIVPLPRHAHVRNELVRLGQALAFDPILSGNKNISCMTCHLPALATGDGKSLSVGEGGVGFGPKREHPKGVFIPRNAPPMFNMAAMRTLFWDGRIAADPHGKVSTPAGDQVTREDAARLRVRRDLGDRHVPADQPARDARPVRRSRQRARAHRRRRQPRHLGRDHEATRRRSASIATCSAMPIPARASRT